MTDFGPQLIGETEKTLNAVLRRVLLGTGLTEPQWVALRIASQNDDRADLAALVSDRAHLADAAGLVAALRDRSLLTGDEPSPAGHQLLAETGARIRTVTAPLWADLPAEDVAATERILTTVAGRARQLLSRG